MRLCACVHVFVCMCKSALSACPCAHVALLCALACEGWCSFAGRPSGVVLPECIAAALSGCPCSALLTQHSWLCDTAACAAPPVVHSTAA